MHARELAERVKRTSSQIESLKMRLSFDKPRMCYKLINTDISSKDSAASIIADAILHEPQALQFVARSIGNNLEMDKTWELMSNFDKDELQQKKIIREL